MVRYRALVVMVGLVGLVVMVGLVGLVVMVGLVGLVGLVGGLRLSLVSDRTKSRRRERLLC
jgi:hypothetical protein